MDSKNDPWSGRSMRPDETECSPNCVTMWQERLKAEGIDALIVWPSSLSLRYGTRLLPPQRISVACNSMNALTQLFPWCQRVAQRKALWGLRGKPIFLLVERGVECTWLMSSRWDQDPEQPSKPLTLWNCLLDQRCLGQGLFDDHMRPIWS